MEDRVLVQRTAWVTRIRQLGRFAPAAVVGAYALSGGADSWLVNLGWLVVAGGFVLWGVRAGRTSLIATDAGLVVRNSWYSRRVPWTAAGVRCRHSLPRALGAWTLIVTEGKRSYEVDAAAGMTRDEIEAAMERINAAVAARATAP